MSRSNSTELQSPAKKQFEWNGDKGGFKTYNRETKENEKVPLPFRFLVLDKLSTIKGYSDHHKAAFWANEVRSTKKDILSVYSKGGLQAEGFYKDIIGTMTGAKYCQVVYIAFYEGKEMSIGKINLVGTALSAWIDFCKAENPEKGAIEVAEMVEGKKGKTVYQTPVFKKITVSEEADKIALGLDVELQAYLAKYLSSHNDQKEPVEAEAQKSNATVEDYKNLGSKNEVAPESTDDLPF